MPAEGKTQREIAEYYGFKDKQVVKKLLKRAEAQSSAGRKPGITATAARAGRGKDAAPRDIVAEQAYEIRRLRMENELLRDFLQSTGRK